MHDSSYVRMEYFVEQYLMDFSVKSDLKISVLDIGSQDVNGSYRPLFEDSRFNYTGLDMSPGKNVDIVPEYPYDWKEVESNSFDAVISGQCLEHVEFPWVTVSEMCRVLKPNGLMCIIAPRGVGRHRYPIDTYRYDADGLAALAKYANLIPLHISMNEAPANAPITWFGTAADCMLIARKPENYSGVLDVKTYKYTKWPMEKLRTDFLILNPLNS